MRYDGYWALADLVGVPDFFTFMGPVVRGMLPATRHRERLGRVTDEEELPRRAPRPPGFDPVPPRVDRLDDREGLRRSFDRMRTDVDRLDTLEKLAELLQVSLPTLLGKSVVGGNFTVLNGANVSRLARLNLDGSLDTTFGIGGRVTTAIGATDDTASASTRPCAMKADDELT